jgi:hypothetical protein
MRCIAAAAAHASRRAESPHLQANPAESCLIARGFGILTAVRIRRLDLSGCCCRTAVLIPAKKRPAAGRRGNTVSKSATATDRESPTPAGELWNPPPARHKNFALFSIVESFSAIARS